MLFIGPEGGFSDEELYFSQQHNALIVNIPKIILRAETAAIVALSITKFIRNFSWNIKNKEDSNYDEN